MARIRTIKPEFPQSESMGNVSREARLCFIQLWTLADDAGRLRGNSRMLASLLYPYDNDAPKLIDKWMKELVDEKCIIRYIVDGQNYVEICNWLNHQKIDKPSQSKMPAPPESSRIFANPLESSSLDQGRDQGEYQGREDASQASQPTPEKLPHGEFGNVKLTDQEYHKLTDRYKKQDVDRVIETMGAWMKSKGKVYKDHYAALLNWIKKDGVQERGPVYRAPGPEQDEGLASPDEIAEVLKRLPIKGFA